MLWRRRRPRRAARTAAAPPPRARAGCGVAGRRAWSSRRCDGCVAVAVGVGAAVGCRPALPLGALRPSRSRRSSCTSARISDSSLARWNQSAKPGSLRCWAWNSRTIIMRSQSGIGTSTRAAAVLAELAEGLRGLVLLVGREIARAQHEAALAPHGRQHAVELALEAAALRRPVAQEDAAVGGEARLVPQREVDGRQLVGQLEPLRR